MVWSIQVFFKECVAGGAARQRSLSQVGYYTEPVAELNQFIPVAIVQRNALGKTSFHDHSFRIAGEKNLIDTVNSWTVANKLGQ